MQNCEVKVTVSKLWAYPAYDTDGNLTLPLYDEPKETLITTRVIPSLTSREIVDESECVL